MDAQPHGPQAQRQVVVVRTNSSRAQHKKAPFFSKNDDKKDGSSKLNWKPCSHKPGSDRGLRVLQGAPGYRPGYPRVPQGTGRGPKASRTPGHPYPEQPSTRVRPISLRQFFPKNEPRPDFLRGHDPENGYSKNSSSTWNRLVLLCTVPCTHAHPAAVATQEDSSVTRTRIAQCH